MLKPSSDRNISFKSFRLHLLTAFPSAAFSAFFSPTLVSEVPRKADGMSVELPPEDGESWSLPGATLLPPLMSRVGGGVAVCAAWTRVKYVTTFIQERGGAREDDWVGVWVPVLAHVLVCTQVVKYSAIGCRDHS